MVGTSEQKRIIKNEFSRIKLFIKNVWMLLAVDPLHKIVFSFWCAVFSLFVEDVVRIAFSRVLINLKGIRYIDKSNMLEVCASPVTVILILLFLIIMTYTALFEIGGLLHSFSMAQIGRKTDIWSMSAAGARTCRKTLAPRNWPILLFVMVLFPLTGLLSLSNAAYKVKVPLFVKLGIEARPLFAATFKMSYLILILIEIGVLFSINIYVLREKSFYQSCIGAVYVHILIPRNANYMDDMNKLTVSKLLGSLKSHGDENSGKLEIFMTKTMLHSKLLMNEQRIMIGSCIIFVVVKTLKNIVS